MSDLATYTGFDSYAEPVESGSFQRMKEIRISSPMSTQDEIPEGHYYISDGNVPKGEKAKLTDLGEKIEVTILRHAKRISDQTDAPATIDSTEFRSWSDLVVLYEIVTKPPVVKAILPYSSPDKSLLTMKKYLEQNYPNARASNLAYVLYEGEVYRMKLSNSDVFGSVQNAQGKDDIQVKEPLKDSLEGLKSKVYQTHQGRIFVAKVQLGSEKVHKKNIRKTFTFVDFHEAAYADTIKAALDELFALLGMLTQKRLAKAMEMTKAENIVSNNIDILDHIYKDPMPLLGKGSYPVNARKVIDAVEVPTLDAAKEVFGEEPKAPAKKASRKKTDEEKMEDAKKDIEFGDKMRAAEHEDKLKQIPDEWK